MAGTKITGETIFNAVLGVLPVRDLLVIRWAIS